MTAEMEPVLNTAGTHVYVRSTYNDMEFNYWDGGGYSSGDGTNTVSNNGTLRDGAVSGIISRAGVPSGSANLALAGVATASSDVPDWIGYGPSTRPILSSPCGWSTLRRR